MDYAQHFSNVLKSDEFVGFKNEWSNTYGVDAKSVRRHANKDGILVVGAGVTGLTTAVRLSLQGYNVKIIAKEFIPKDTMVCVIFLCYIIGSPICTGDSLGPMLI